MKDKLKPTDSLPKYKDTDTVSNKNDQKANFPTQ